MQKQFYVSHNAKDLGPFSKEDIQMKVQKKELSLSDFVYIEQKEDWVSLSDFLGSKQTAAPVHVTQKTFEKSAEKTVTDFKLEDAAYGKSPKHELHKTEAKHIENKFREVTHTQVVHTPKVEHKHAEHKHVEHKHVEHNTVRFEKGEAKMSVHNDKVGVLTIAVDTKKLGLQVETKAEIKFVAGQATQIHWEAPTEVNAGHVAKFSFRALDKYGNVDVRFDGTVLIESTHKVEGLGVVQFKAGLAHKDLRWTKAESVEFRVIAQSHPTLECKRSHRVNFKSAQASKILIESQNEARVGDEVYITVRAVDAYGNLDTNFNEAVTLHLSGVQSKEAEVRLSHGMGTYKVS